MARCNCAPCLVCGYGKCDCECVDGGPYLTADSARIATLQAERDALAARVAEVEKLAANWRSRANDLAFTDERVDSKTAGRLCWTIGEIRAGRAYFDYYLNRYVFAAEFEPCEKREPVKPD